MNTSSQTPTPSTHCKKRQVENKILTGVPIVNHDDVMDIGALCASELHLLKKNDPFMYYSIPGAKNPCLTENDLDQLLPSLVIGSSRSTLTSDSEHGEAQPRPRNRRRSMSDSHLVVKRRSRISYESDMLETIIGEMGELEARHAKRRRSSHCSEIIGESRIQLSPVENTESRGGSILQDILFSMFESEREDVADDQSSE
ncbi:hypothetical protein HJC23_003004 [Cyclotella cryptica]|uniref:Uncharacterized protein n=1 Tax=Cyclotella cryptica TaxID=29204 RepID=A0ABD3PSL7_9STRA